MNDWWKTLEPIYKESGDGQRMQWHYARESKKGWEYAIVNYADDGTFISVMILKNGKAKYVEGSEQ